MLRIHKNATLDRHEESIEKKLDDNILLVGATEYFEIHSLNDEQIFLGTL